MAKWKEGDLCRCGQDNLRVTEVRSKPKPAATYRFLWKLSCFACGRIFYDDDAKIQIEPRSEYSRDRLVLRELIADLKVLADRLAATHDSIDAYESAVHKESKNGQ
jgi:hypothetical protein